jgi:hypothetical protein
VTTFLKVLISHFEQARWKIIAYIIAFAATFISVLMPTLFRRLEKRHATHDEDKRQRLPGGNEHGNLGRT